MGHSLCSDVGGKIVSDYSSVPNGGGVYFFEAVARVSSVIFLNIDLLCNLDVSLCSLRFLESTYPSFWFSY
jgi:hypothetical protein